MSDGYQNLRALCEAIAEAEHESRKLRNQSVVMGVHWLVWKVRKFQHEHHQRVEDPDTVRRRYAELVYEENGHRLDHVGDDQAKFYDFKPNEFSNDETHAYELQSCYVLNRPEDAARIAADIKAAQFEKRFGKAQSQILA